jgi:hypothetical protein
VQRHPLSFQIFPVMPSHRLLQRQATTTDFRESMSQLRKI